MFPRSPTPGEPLFVSGRVVDRAGRPIAGAEVDIWHSSPVGLYENQDPGQADMNLRGKFTSDAEGRFWFSTVKMVGYPIPIDGVVGRCKRIAARVQRHLALVREGHQVGQVGIGADEVGGDGDLAENHRHGGERHGAAVAHQVVRAPGAQHRDGVADRAVLSHEVEDRVGAQAGEVTDLLRLLAAGVNLVICAPGHGELQGFLAGIHGDDRSRGHGLEALDTDMTQPAGPATPAIARRTRST